LIVEERQIIEGSVVLGYEYVQRAARLQRSALYLHELGHALGLAHGASQQDAMYYIVGATDGLSPMTSPGFEPWSRPVIPLVSLIPGQGRDGLVARWPGR
jgi:hypothetical protein